MSITTEQKEKDKTKQFMWFDISKLALANKYYATYWWWDKEGNHIRFTILYQLDSLYQFRELDSIEIEQGPNMQHLVEISPTKKTPFVIIIEELVEMA